MKILLVEDDRRLWRFIARGLQEDGHVVETRENGLDAEDQLFYGDYDVVILDLMLPGQSGLEVLRHVRQAGVDVPILVLTARDQLSDKVRALDSGADDYLVKPFAFEELVARLRALQRRGRSRPPTTLQCGSLKIDVLEHRAYCKGKDLQLTRTEFAVLAYLCRHRDHLVTRAQLEQAVWGDDFERDSNVVAVYINYLRKKLKRCGEQREILETVRGSGYRLRNLPE